ncbi:MAG TPA: LLM class flavin-dependent oxidoreductase [Acidimicrobiales bacterium]|nr:LLM class flavin-dependent oxidoreductase [Acidimicrobiales bacterium]
MRHGFIIPGGSASEQVELAVLAEEAGWDGVFVWEGGYALDAWSLLAAMAVRTRRVRLGTMLTPLPWRRPWKLAGQVATVDQLSNGRAILTVGVGAVDTGLGTYPEVADLRERADLLDAGIDAVRGLWEGDDHAGGLDLSTSIRKGPTPVQDPLPIWVVAIPGRPKSMRRALRCDGVVPQSNDPAEVAALLTWLDDNGGRRPAFDVVVEGETTPGDASPVEPWHGIATWWLESRWMTEDPDEVRGRIEAGPVPSAG